MEIDPTRMCALSVGLPDVRWSPLTSGPDGSVSLSFRRPLGQCASAAPECMVMEPARSNSPIWRCSARVQVGVAQATMALLRLRALLV